MNSNFRYGQAGVQEKKVHGSSGDRGYKLVGGTKWGGAYLAPLAAPFFKNPKKYIFFF